jgi:hypothetical protein
MPVERSPPEPAEHLNLLLRRRIVRLVGLPTDPFTQPGSAGQPAIVVTAE